jgi:hypothetical protein
MAMNARSKRVRRKKENSATGTGASGLFGESAHRVDLDLDGLSPTTDIIP